MDPLCQECDPLLSPTACGLPHFCTFTGRDSPDLSVCGASKREEERNFRPPPLSELVFSFFLGPSEMFSSSPLWSGKAFRLVRDCSVLRRQTTAWMIRSCQKETALSTRLSLPLCLSGLYRHTNMRRHHMFSVSFRRCTDLYVHTVCVSLASVEKSALPPSEAACVDSRTHARLTLYIHLYVFICRYR